MIQTDIATNLRNISDSLSKKNREEQLKFLRAFRAVASHVHTTDQNALDFNVGQLWNNLPEAVQNEASLEALLLVASQIPQVDLQNNESYIQGFTTAGALTTGQLALHRKGVIDNGLVAQFAENSLADPVQSFISGLLVAAALLDNHTLQDATASILAVNPPPVAQAEHRYETPPRQRGVDDRQPPSIKEQRRSASQINQDHQLSKALRTALSRQRPIQAPAAAPSSPSASSSSQGGDGRSGSGPCP